MSKDMERLVDLLINSNGLLTFADFIKDVWGSREEIYIDTGVYDHLFDEDRDYIFSKDIFKLYCPKFGVDQCDIEELFEDCGKYIKKFEEATGRSFFINSICKESDNYWKMYWDS